MMKELCVQCAHQMHLSSPFFLSPLCLFSLHCTAIYSYVASVGASSDDDMMMMCYGWASEPIHLYAMIVSCTSFAIAVAIAHTWLLLTRVYFMIGKLTEQWNRATLSITQSIYFCILCNKYWCPIYYQWIFNPVILSIWIWRVNTDFDRNKQQFRSHASNEWFIDAMGRNHSFIF